MKSPWQRHTKRCLCGKIHAATRKEAEYKHKIWAGGVHNANPVRYYACKYGSWHWTSNLDATKYQKPKTETTKPKAPDDGLTPDQRAWLADLAAEADEP